MRRRFIKLLFLLAALIGAGTGAAADVKYRGFSIAESAIGKAENLPAIHAAICEQIDMVCAVGVPAPMLEFFRGVRFEVVPTGAGKGNSPGLYNKGSKTVRVTAGIVTTGHKPVLLHELLHALHHQQVERGFNNPTIAGLYQHAKAAGVFVARSHMMSNDREFFACAGTTYLFGVTAQEPFQREKIGKNQPELLSFLKTLFGEGAGNYAGSLSR